MLLYHWRGATQNFGDELNRLIWPNLLPGFFNDDPAEVFLGIGSVLDARHPPGALKIVAGAGYGGYEKPPVLDETWAIHWVRGPRTARQLALPEQLGLGDPAMLLPHASSSRRRGPSAAGVSIGHIGFMPHFESLERGAWQAAAAAAGVSLIDPRADATDTISAIARCRVLISEALHGVIVADALRVPWIALEPLLPIHRAKWLDWADTLDLRIVFQRLAPSTLLEQLQSFRTPRHRVSHGLISAADALFGPMVSRRFLRRAAKALMQAATAPPQLSQPSALERCQDRMLARLDLLRRDPRCGSATRSALPHGAKTAYQHPSSG